MTGIPGGIPANSTHDLWIISARNSTGISPGESDGNPTENPGIPLGSHRIPVESQLVQWSDSVWPFSHISKSLITSLAQIKHSSWRIRNIAVSIFSLLRKMHVLCGLFQSIYVGFIVVVYSKSHPFTHITLFLLRTLLPLLMVLALWWLKLLVSFLPGSETIRSQTICWILDLPLFTRNPMYKSE